MKRCQNNFDVSSDQFKTKMKLIGALLYKYDSEFWSYLHLEEDTDLSFVYRWLLIECKREFSFNDSLRVLEVMWSSLNNQQENVENFSEHNLATNDLINGFNSYNYDYYNFGRSNSNASSISSRLLKQIGNNANSFRTSSNAAFDYFNDDYLISNDDEDVEDVGLFRQDKHEVKKRKI